MIGIYKITSPSGKVYIGQSTDIQIRFNSYEKLNCKTQIKLHRSLNKYGVKNHIFEIIKECEIEELSNLERYYQDLYEVCGKMGLNCKLTTSSDKSGRLSKETIKKISNAVSGENHPMYGKIHSEESKNKISNTKKGTKHSEEHKRKIGEKLKGNQHCLGKKASEETKKKMSEIRKGKNKKGLIVIRVSDGKFYDSVSEAAIDNKIPGTTLRKWLLGKTRNKTNFRYLDNN